MHIFTTCLVSTIFLNYCYLIMCNTKFHKNKIEIVFFI